jgi:hypothetical protein
MIVILLSSISKLQHALLPPKMLRARKHAPTIDFSIVFTLDSHLSLSKNLGARHMGRVPKSHSIHVQNPTKSPFLNKDLVWRSGICHGGQNKVTIQFVYVPYARISKFLEGECGDTSTCVEWNVYKNCPNQTNVKQPIIKNHLGHTW